MDNRAIQDNETVRLGMAELTRRLPSGWLIESFEQKRSARSVDAEFSIVGPDGRRALVFLEAKRNLDPRRASWSHTETDELLLRVEGRSYEH